MTAPGNTLIKTLSTTETDINPSAYPNLLLLTTAPPNTILTGALMLYEMFKAWPKEKLSCFSLMNSNLSPQIHKDFAGIPYKHMHKPNEHKPRRLPRVAGEVECYLKEQYTKHNSIPKITAQIAEFARKNNTQMIWCTVEGQTMIRVAHQLQEELKLPMVAQVWDPPGWWLRDNQVDRWTQSDVLSTFQKVLKNSQAVAAASFAMADEYRSSFGADAIAVMPGVPMEWIQPPAKSLNSDSNSRDKLVIGFAGQMYANEEWDDLLSALDALNWKVGQRDVEIHVLGRKFQLHRLKYSNIRYLGWRSQQESIELMSRCDLLFCPYWFSKTYELEAKLSFPSKLSTFLAAGRPVIFYGPDYASPARFIKENQAGFPVCDNKGDALKTAIERLATDTMLYEQLAKNGNQALKNFLTAEYMKTQFLKSLGCAQAV